MNSQTLNTCIQAYNQLGIKVHVGGLESIKAATRKMRKHSLFKSAKTNSISACQLIHRVHREHAPDYDLGSDVFLAAERQTTNCELSTLAYLISAELLGLGKVFDRLSLVSFDNLDESHVAIKIPHSDLVWEPTKDSGNLVPEEEYKSRFTRVTHHNQRAKQQLPASVILGLLESLNHKESPQYLDMMIKLEPQYPCGDLLILKKISLLWDLLDQTRTTGELARLYKQLSSRYRADPRYADAMRYLKECVKPKGA